MIDCTARAPPSVSVTRVISQECVSAECGPVVKSDSSVQGANNGRQRFFLWNTARSISVGVDAGQGMMDGGRSPGEVGREQQKGVSMERSSGRPS